MSEGKDPVLQAERTVSRRRINEGKAARKGLDEARTSPSFIYHSPLNKNRIKAAPDRGGSILLVD